MATLSARLGFYKFAAVLDGFVCFAVKAYVKDTWLASHLGPQSLNGISRDKFAYSTMGVIEVAKNACASVAGIDACRKYSLVNAVQAEVAFLGRLGPGVAVLDSVGACLNAIAASDARFLVLCHDAVIALHGGPRRTGFDTGRVIAVVAKNGHKLALRVRIPSLFTYHNPTFEVAERHILFRFAGDRAGMAPKASAKVNYHAVSRALARLVCFYYGAAARQPDHNQAGAGCTRPLEKIPSADCHFTVSLLRQ